MVLARSYFKTNYKRVTKLQNKKLKNTIYLQVILAAKKKKRYTNRKNEFRQIHRNYLFRQTPKYKISFPLVTFTFSIATKRKESVIQSFV